MNRVDRLLALILFLQSQPVSTAEEMARHFGRSVRTIYRDLSALGEIGVPVIAEVGLGYSLARGYHLPPVSFTSEEASALITGGLLVDRTADFSVQRSMRSALRKVRAVLPRPLQSQIVRLEASLATTAIPDHPRRAASLAVVQQALAQCRVMKVHYQGWGKAEAGERTIEPLGLVHYLERWHLIAWCRRRAAVRDFRLDRMSQVSLLKESFEPHSEFSLSAYLEALPQPHLRAEVRFSSISVDRVRREWWPGIHGEQESAGGPVLTLGTVDWDQLTRFLLSFGTDAEVLSPESLRRDLVRAARDTARHHSRIPHPC